MNEQTNVKFQLSILAIFVSSLMLFGLIYFAVDRIPNTPKEAQKELSSLQEISHHEILERPVDRNQNEAFVDDKTVSQIQGIASLSDNELKQEFSALGDRLKNENLFHKLEQKQLDQEEKAQAKALIERYTLLGLEGTRRKYLPLEPELKDAVYAHRDSLKDIRKLIDRY